MTEPPAGGNQGSSQQGVAPPLDVPTVERGSRSSGSPNAEITPAAGGRDERAGRPLRPRSWFLPIFTLVGLAGITAVCVVGVIVA